MQHGPVNMLVNFKVVFHWHGCDSQNFATVSIACANMSHSKHYKFLILVNVEFVSKVVSRIRNWIGLPCCVVSPSDMITRCYTPETSTYSINPCNDAVCTKCAVKSPTSINWTNLYVTNVLAAEGINYVPIFPLIRYFKV